MLSTTLGALDRFVRQRYEFPGPLESPAVIVIPRGTPEQIGDVLRADGVIRDVFSFRVAALATRAAGPLHAGEFAFPRGASLREVLAILRTAKPVEHHITIPEGLTAAQIATLLDHNSILVGDTPIPAEGTVLPETYAFERGATRASVLARASAAMERALARIWAARAADLPLASPAQLLALASIVERETARPDERPHVAAVFLNRLRSGMKLQADPTVAYAASGGSGVLGRSITRADLEWDNPYNTYVVTGLPPGPIDSPGVAALEATAHPLASDDLFFVADGTGGHVFARTLEDHQRNVARWRALNAREKPGP